MGYYPNIWASTIPLVKPIGNDVRSLSSNKQRVVFAGSNFQARADQTYIQPLSVFLKTRKTRGGDQPVQASTSNQDVRDLKLYKMLQYQILNSLASSGDDKSGFDMKIHLAFTVLFPAMFIVPLFRDRSKAREYWKHSIISRALSGIITFDGYHLFLDSTDSGGTTTFHKGSETCGIGGLFAEALITGISPITISRRNSENGVTSETAGDDYFGIVDPKCVGEDVVYASDYSSASAISPKNMYSSESIISGDYSCGTTNKASKGGY